MARILHRARGRMSSGDDGQVLLLTIGFVVVAVTLVLVVSAAAQVHLERKRLVALADLVAVEAADEVPGDVYFGGPAPAIGITSASVRSSAERYLASHPTPGRWDQVTVLEAVSDDGRSARVVLGASMEVPFLGALVGPWPDIALRAESISRGH